MKKICLMLALCLLLSALTGCGGENTETTEATQPVVVPALQGEAQTVDTSDLKEYELDCGLGFYGPAGLKEEEIDGLAGYMKSSLFIVMVICEPRTGTVLEDVTLEEYAAMLSDSNGLAPFVTDCYGTLATTNTAQGFDSEDVFFYYVTVHEGSDCFWLIQTACLNEMAQDAVGNMARWSATFTEIEQ